MNKAAIQDAFVGIITLRSRQRMLICHTHVSNVPRNNIQS
jgi:hypothetical protein